ncbi:hypothetical protein JJB07_16150 [Tumebacillus sp. ITR2]|uniref:Uncharacterized protein n=1 Tax=Tumebacillus amylolyticus TaxID=2801339 RepID=A0ABS1JD09_9BACL|nr:hypothetical protein [Tumebacillus amylolyticus]MBL0388150.1 hypothetical protein [Tumebacillus amylolyticus]
MKKVVLAGVLVAVALFLTVAAGVGTAQKTAGSLIPIPCDPNVFTWGD